MENRVQFSALIKEYLNKAYRLLFSEIQLDRGRN